jgi:3-hydroxyisobutyryl-CoA hydrolase
VCPKFSHLLLIFTDFRTSECGLATHYIPSSRIPQLLSNLASLDNPTHSVIDSTIEELYQERDSSEQPPIFVGEQRKALDLAFQYNDIQLIIEELESLAASGEGEVNEWAKKTLEELSMRSPTSLKVALHAIRSAKGKSLKECLQTDLGIATAFCVSPSSPLFGALPTFLSPLYRTALVQILRKESKQC